MQKKLTAKHPVRIVGIDLDNTVVNYTRAVYALALSKGYVAPEEELSKREIRDRVRDCSGDIEWQMMQAMLYTSSIKDAEPYPGVKRFLHRARGHGIRVFVVSHKTEYANCDETRTPLRPVALEWLRGAGFFDEGTGLVPGDVFFESTREEKIGRIRSLGCTDFVDDLVEVLTEPAFPEGVRKILFAPSPDDVHGDCSEGAEVLGSWSDIAERLLPRSEEDDLVDGLASLPGAPVFGLKQLHGGRNSRVYALLRDGEDEALVLKRYYRDAADPRDRLRVELDALTFLWNGGVRIVPRPVAAFPEKGCAVYGRIDGERIPTEGVSEKEILQAVDFLGLLKDMAKSGESLRLPNASEACFTIGALHFNLRLRLDRLKSVDDTLLKEFMNEELLPVFDHLTRSSPEDDAPLDLSQRTLSPSDFGFHNALKGKDGVIRFMDFEYFGWDDPAKAVCDFLLHPAMNLDRAARRIFLRNISPIYGAEKLAKRFAMVYPLYVLKWCAILLNEFLPERMARRRFSLENALDERSVHAEQLRKARRILKRIEDRDEELEHIA